MSLQYAHRLNESDLGQFGFCPSRQLVIVLLRRAWRYSVISSFQGKPVRVIITVALHVTAGVGFWGGQEKGG
jgi:hypothetical protein